MIKTTVDDEFRKEILQAEIAALLHDIGKLSGSYFLNNKLDEQCGEDKHGGEFQEYCAKELANVLFKEVSVPVKWMTRTAGSWSFKKLGDLITVHHLRTKDLEKFGYKKEPREASLIPLTAGLISIADTLDSAYSKGGATMNNGRLNDKKFIQQSDTCYLATPFGEKEARIDIDKVDVKMRRFHAELTPCLAGYENWNLEDLKRQRERLMDILRHYLSADLAETRIPTNDVTIWQHLYSTAAIFKAMYCRHLLLNDNVCQDENGELAHHHEKLSFFGVRWSEDALLVRTVRPVDILGRRGRLYRLAEAIKQTVETNWCLGNEYYRDRDGIVFLIPDHAESDAIRGFISEMMDDLESIINRPDFFPGDLQYRFSAKSVGIQILGLSVMVAADGTGCSDFDLRTGPKHPGWIGEWESLQGGASEICSRCGLRPVNMRPTGVGSEADEEKICSFCSALQVEAGNIRYSGRSAQKRLLGMGEGADFVQYQTDKLVSSDADTARLALIQGFFDLDHFFSGEAFSLILAKQPEDFSKPVQDRSADIQNWDNLLLATQNAWNDIRQKQLGEEDLLTLRQLFCDTRLGRMNDGRVEGNTKIEKLENYISRIVLAAPSIARQEESTRIAVYALRQHPAPSRITRVAGITENICREAFFFCERAKIPYFPVSLDPGRFMILVSADYAWTIITRMYDHYVKSAGRVRHLLPLHLSAAVFYKKFPLYVAIDAMRRCSTVQLSAGKKQNWTLKSREKQEENYLLQWQDPGGRPVSWRMPAMTPNNKPEHFFSWFWDVDKKRPVRLDQLEAGASYPVCPSTFDYEVLDATVRRYDIRVGANGKSRPHLFCGDAGPRPFPLEVLDQTQWRDAAKALQKVEKHQLSRLLAFITSLHSQWKNCPADVFRAQTKDYLRLTMEQSTDAMVDMAVSGALFDIIEWQHFIGTKIKEEK